MFNDLILSQARVWLSSPDCKVRAVIDYIVERKRLRRPQTEAIIVYLYLKIAGGNRPLWQLFSEGFFSTHQDFAKLPLSAEARETFETKRAARALFEFVRRQNAETDSLTLSEGEKRIVANVNRIDYVAAAREIFYNVEYADYLFSLPMGAGKTFLMASLIYLDLYFAQLEPHNNLFAHNFLILIPSGLKSSIVPSLRAIENFDPTWVVPEPAASNLKRLVKFEVLDEAKSARRSTRAQNPNAQKINQHQPLDSLMGLIAIVNAEKVILDRLELSAQQDLIEKTEDEKDRQANELRNLIGKIPNLQIHIDEVHHAADDEIKLRQVVNKWTKGGSVNSVLGFSGTPYATDKIALTDDVNLTFTQITNTVYFYPLLDAIRTFLKKPAIKSETGLTSQEIVRQGVKEFYENYRDKIYRNGTRAKLAIYCGNINRLEEEIYPFLTDDLRIAPDKILKFHKGNKEYSTGKDAWMEFRALDTPFSQKEIVLLVQIGKEGWDCRSLTGVVLSQKGDCKPNMVLQTSCRCLRQVDEGGLEAETALVWLNADNARVLQKQLKEEQQTDIAAINSAGKDAACEKTVERYARLEQLHLPALDFHQWQIKHQVLEAEENAAPLVKLRNLDAARYRHNAVITTQRFGRDDVLMTQLVEATAGEAADFQSWLLHIGKASFGRVSLAHLRALERELRAVFETITHEADGARVFDDLYDRVAIEEQIRLAFYRRREIKTHSEIIPAEAKMLIVESLRRIADNPKLYPNERETEQILELDRSGQDTGALQTAQDEKQRQLQELLKTQGRLDLLDIIENKPQIEYSNAVLYKNRSFHFLPYNFAQSNLEKTFLERVLSLEDFQKCDLQIFFNGEKDITDFRIECFEKRDGKRWQRTGLYTPDFLVIERDKAEKIRRVLIIETKGKGFAAQPEFLARRRFVENEFLRFNNERAGYRRFEYLYLTDEDRMDANLHKFRDKLREFFCA